MNSSFTVRDRYGGEGPNAFTSLLCWLPVCYTLACAKELRLNLQEHNLKARHEPCWFTIKVELFNCHEKNMVVKTRTYYSQACAGLSGGLCSLCRLLVSCIIYLQMASGPRLPKS